jgi:SAM-dependent methyltransferase
VRWRAVIRTLSIELFGVTLSLPDFPCRPDILGLGLSDVDIYAVPLAAKLGYTNTFYHREPRLDIMAIPDEFRGRFDFVISSDVFEHVAPPIDIAFQNTRALLRPGGVLVLTVPFVDSEDPTTEHFPSLHNYQLRRSDQGEVLENVTRDGRRETFNDLTFHEGGGEVLEMRRFTRGSVVAELLKTGFEGIKIYGDADLVHGITWPDRQPLPIAAHAA